MNPYYDENGITIYHGDCLEVLPSLTSVELVVVDPPYTFGLASTIREGKAGSWSDLMNNATWYAAWLQEIKRLTFSSQGAAWVFNSWRAFPVLARATMSIQWPIESLCVWDKEWIGPGGARGLRPSYELIALLCQPGFALENRGLPDIWRCMWSAIKPTGHPAEKPEPLIGKIIDESLNGKGGTVLDPFTGSGTTLFAAKRLGYNAIGIEAEERYCEMAAKRLGQEVLAIQ